MNLSYLAGFFDGEGCLWLATRLHSRVAFLIAVVNTDRRPLREFKRRWGGTIHPIVDSRPRMKPRIVWRWSLSGAPARRALLQMRKYLVVKAPQVTVWLRAWNEITTRPRGDRRVQRERWFQRKLSALKRI